ncbi:acetyl-CoA hydrolase/transferase family protein [Ideonella livida]|uniref:Acetyl-CoA hydrolase/transferase family protein n=1 Tax=Ideonella livida TaxID=2707176 RepID=A0A7C9PHM1_9BURK|nr:acetyl-CoA hydrolase/transferase family protein [Ideonella livida]NDY91274.1 acetyl-CoA hydrolase/transferase family protein [Ideonella livida]
MSSRILHPGLRGRLMSADLAAALIHDGDNVGMSGFTGSGSPKVVPQALARRIDDAHHRGEHFRIGVWTGASTSAELDGALAKVNAMDLRLPYQSDPQCRARINAGQMDYIDVHLSHVAQYVWFGFFGPLDVAVVEVAGILEDGRLIPSTSIGNNKTWLEQAGKVILEVNSWQPAGLEGMHDVYYGTERPPHRKPIPLVHPNDRIGEPYLKVDLDKVVAVVETHHADKSAEFSPPDATSRAIAGHILDFLQHEVKHGRLPAELLPLQSGVGNIANAVLEGLNNGPFKGLTAYTEVLQDGMLEMLKSGTLASASSAALALSPAALAEFNADLDHWRRRVVLRPQEISNHPELIRRLGIIAMNGMIEADIYGNVNSTHVMGSSIMNGIGGSGDFARNAYLSIFMAPSTAKGGAISTLVPMVSHVDHTEHDVQVLVTENGLADLRGKSPRKRAELIIQHCAHPSFRPELQDYLERARAGASGQHTPHLLDEALSWHGRYLKTGHMR